MAFGFLVLGLCVVSASVVPDNLVQWIDAHGVKVNEKVNVDQEQLIMYTTEAVEAGAELVSVPTHLTFRSILRDDDEALTFIKTATSAENVDPRVSLVLSLLKEQTSRTSNWSPWLNSLPSELRCPLFFTDDEMSYLNGHDVYARLVQHRDVVAATWEQLVSKVVDSDVTQDKFTQAFALVSGFRTIIKMSEEDPSPIFALIPIISVARHSHSPNAGVQTRVLKEGELSTLFQPGVAEFVLTATEDIPANTEISLSYGFNDNYESFLAQGVTENGDTLDSITFVAQQPSSELLSLLESVGVTSLEFKVTPTSIPITLLQYLRVKNGANVMDEEIKEALASGKGISMENDRLALAELLKTLKSLRSQWPSSVEEDRAQIANTELSLKSRLAIQYRMREKSVLSGVERLVKEVWAVWMYALLPPDATPDAVDNKDGDTNASDRGSSQSQNIVIEEVGEA